MRFKQYINESKEVPWEDIKRSCKPYLKEVYKAKNMLYRYIWKMDEFWIRKKVRTNRKPKDTPKVYHEFVDDMLKKRFGWKPRSEGLFVWGKAHGRNLGLGSIVFPIGKFKFVWNPEVLDLFNTINIDVVRGVSEEEIRRTLINLIPGYTNEGFMSALKQHNEIIIGCKEYYAVSVQVMRVNKDKVEEILGIPEGYY